MRRVALAATVLGTLGIAFSYATAFASPPLSNLGAPVMVIAMSTGLMGVMLMGIDPKPGAGSATWLAVVAVFAVVAGGLLTAMFLPPDGGDDILWLGLPRRAAIVIYVVGLLPLFVLPAVYAIVFNSQTLDERDLDRMKAARHQ